MSQAPNLSPNKPSLQKKQEFIIAKRKQEKLREMKERSNTQ